MRYPSRLHSVRFRLAVAYSVAAVGLAIVVVAAAMATADNQAGAALLGLASLGPALVAVGLFLGDRAFRRYRELTAAADRIAARSDRIALAGPDDEWKHLADTVDAMLGRIEDRVEERWALVQDLSHELRNPLAVMATTLDVALGDEEASVEELRRSAAVVRRTVDRLAANVDDLVVLARNETPASRRTQVDVSRVLEEVLAEHRGPLDAQRLSVERWTQSVPVNGDRDAVKRAIGNIVGNAVRLSRPGSVLRVGTGSHLGFAWVGVDDQGPGLDPRLHDQVFRRFWSSDTASLSGEKRAGLGLAITRQIAELHGGLVTLRSTFGEGAEFVIWIPQTPDADLAEISADGIHPLLSPLLDTEPIPPVAEPFIPA